jgi:hypothetical protein
LKRVQGEAILGAINKARVEAGFAPFGGGNAA